MNSPESIVGLSIGVALIAFGSYMTGLDHADTNLRMENAMLKQESARNKAILKQGCVREGAIKKLSYDLMRGGK